MVIGFVGIRSLKARARLSKGKNLVAVPYVGAGAGKLLPLGRGDILLCALSETNCWNGSVSPREVRVLQKRGVQVFIREDLHAKLYLLGGHAIVASANPSQHSLSALDEAALHTSEKKVVQEMRAWFEDRMGEPVTPKWLAHCTKIYRPPKTPGQKRRLKGKKQDALGRRVWLVGTHEMEFPESESSMVAAGEKTAKLRLQNKRRYKVDIIRWTGTRRSLRLIQRGDVLVESHEGEVYPHGRVLEVRRKKSRDAAQVTYVFYDALKKPSPMPWRRFRAKCAAFGLRLGAAVDSREIRDPLRQNRLLTLTSPEGM